LQPRRSIATAPSSMSAPNVTLAAILHRLLPSPSRECSALRARWKARASISPLPKHRGRRPE
jgi:hypothetical protein